MQDAPKTVWSIPYVSVTFFQSLKQNFIEYRSFNVSSRSDCIFEIHQLWQSGFSRVCSNCCCSCSFQPEILKISQSSHKVYSNNVPHFQESAPILNSCKKKTGNLLKAPRISNKIYNHSELNIMHENYTFLKLFLQVNDVLLYSHPRISLIFSRLISLLKIAANLTVKYSLQRLVYWRQADRGNEFLSWTIQI